MTYLLQNRVTVKVNTQLRHSWTFNGMPGENLGAVMRIFWKVARTEKGWGIVVRDEMSVIPEQLELTAMQPTDMDTHHGRVYWMEGGNGLCLGYNGKTIPFLTLERVTEDAAEVYFHFPTMDVSPEHLGEITITDDIFLELATA